MSKILIIAEHAHGQLNNSTARALSCALAIGGEINVLVLADGGQPVAEAAAQLAGVNGVTVINHAANSHPISAILAPQIVELAGPYSHVLAPNTTFGKDLMPRVAALLGAAMVTDIMAVHDSHNFDRPIFAGNAVTTIQAPAAPCVVATARCASWPPVSDSQTPATITHVETAAELPSHTRYIGLAGEQGDRPDLQSANRVVSGGRGLGGAEHFVLIEKLADKLKAGVGASRAAVDAGWVANDLQVGQTGKIIAPDLYIAAGISGAIQHLAGIKDAGTIVAINQDPDAAIFELADIGLVADLHTALPELTDKL